MGGVTLADPLAALPGIDAHPHARAVLGPALPPHGSPSHAYLFHGPPGSGKRALARSFAAALLADGAVDPTTVAERVARGSHPDLVWVRPSGAAEMLVSDIDEPVIAGATRTPFESTRRVFVIESAQTMNDQAANRMLKTLEEPPSFVHLILLAERPQDVLATITSRCQAVRFDPLSSEAIQARLRDDGVAEADATDCARLALGDVTFAQWLAGAQGQALRADAETFARCCVEGETAHRPWLALIDRAKAAGELAGEEIKDRLARELELLPKKEHRRLEREATEAERRSQRRERTSALGRGLHLTELWLRDAWCQALGASELAYVPGRLKTLNGETSAFEPRRLSEGIELVAETRMRLAVNVSEELALEALAYRLQRLFVPAPD
jgi:DNA polymerase-3 subunit delta'